MRHQNPPTLETLAHLDLAHALAILEAFVDKPRSKTRDNQQAEWKLDALSDLDKKTALETLAAMEYSDIRKLSYRQAIRLWAPLQRSRKGWKGDSTLVIACQLVGMNALKNRLSDLEDLWKEANKTGGARYPSIEGCDYWYEARTKGSPDFIFSEDGTHLQWVGVG